MPHILAAVRVPCSVELGRDGMPDNIGEHQLRQPIQVEKQNTTRFLSLALVAVLLPVHELFAYRRARENKPKDSKVASRRDRPKVEWTKSGALRSRFNDYSFSMYTPSIIASSSIAAALHGLDWTTKSSCSLNQLLDLLHRITAIEKDFLQSCLQKIEDMVTRTMSSRSGEGGEGCTSSGNGGGSSGTNSRNNLDHAAANEKVMEHGKAGTPTDVRDVHF
uniref:Cyclin C-terminal domain-containing protein n=1 Tax=Timema douglasi TaxID=61478 RepID=A0A7R8VM37_TIMDO|nr:unnamed protein product [Timema douglasi]